MQFILLRWRRFESSRVTAWAMCVEGEEPLDPGLERFGVRRSGTFLQRVRSVCGYVMSGGTRWSGPKPMTREDLKS
jgi:hypothetical protein